MAAHLGAYDGRPQRDALGLSGGQSEAVRGAVLLGDEGRAGRRGGGGKGEGERARQQRGADQKAPRDATPQAL
jgi:hypothetical protein